jgi:dolichol-phosphate mannosyltransferase
VTHRRLAVVLPAHNEEEGIAGFLPEIAAALAPHVATLEFFVVDDLSTDGTAQALARLAQTLPLTVLANAENLGHGPSALRAWRAGLDSGADVIVHVDGDGQFLGSDFPRLLAALEGADGVHGVRQHRSDAWYRRVLTQLVRMLARPLAGRSVADVNTPLRAYRREALARLLERVPAGSLVPHVHFSIAEKRLGIRIVECRVTSIPRRGSVTGGTMWGAATKPRRLPSRRLMLFAWHALVEVLRNPR